MTASGMAFREIEHKFLVDATFDREAFCARVEALQPKDRSSVAVRDTYYVLEGRWGYVYRHRLDAELQQLTVKSLEDDPENRLEVNLDLTLGHGDQSHRVNAFLSSIGVSWSGTVHKQVDAFYFDGCEIVFYTASFDGRSFRCVEFEAVDAENLASALEILDYFEQRLGFQSKPRCPDSLFELLVAPSLPAEVRRHFSSRKE